MADRGDTHYSIPQLNAWFLVSSVLLLGALAWMMLNDHHRPWKHYQREFRQLEAEQARADVESLEQGGALKTKEELQAQVDAAQQALEGRQGDLDQAKEEMRLAKGELWKATEKAKKIKSQFNWDRFNIEVEREQAGDPTLGREELVSIEEQMNEAAGGQEQAQRAFDAASDRVAKLTAQVEDAKSALSAGTRDLAAAQKKLEQLAPTDEAAKIANVVRDDIPGLDFIGPNLKVKKVVLSDLTFELNFTKKHRIDMCQTCHLGIDRKGFEDAPQPFTSHPDLDLYTTSKSPHALKDVGCTICHRGSGEALDFVRADHRPTDEEEQARWEEQYDWHKQHHWDYPMLSSGFIEASCVQCHKSSMELIADAAPRVTAGYRTFERYGCYACHKVDWFPTSRRPGPSLKNLQAKMKPEFITSWITNPKDFRPTTWMPQFFHLENYGPEDVVVRSNYGDPDAGRPILGQEWNDAAVAAVTAFLLEDAPAKPFPKVPVQGDAHRGREVMRVSGCFACHNTAPYGDPEPAPTDPTEQRRGTNEHGPNLRGVASKVNAEWLYAWIKDPTVYWPDTRMPNLRLSEQDAADITAYMMEDPDGIFTDVPAGWKPALVSMPEGQLREVLAEQARWHFARDGRATVQARLEGQDPQHRWDDLHTLEVAVGRKTVAQYGCFSCHEISGMEDMMPIGTELSTWGSKTVDKLDFAFGGDLFGLDHNYREGWLMQKLHQPRSYDRDKVKNPTEKLRMPWFNFTDQQVQEIATFVVGLVNDEVQHADMEPDRGQAARDAGMRVVRQKNCVACHMIDPGTVTYIDADDVQRTVTAELLAVGDSDLPPRHDVASLDAALKAADEEEIGIQFLRPEPQLEMPIGERDFFDRENLIALGAPHGGDFIEVLTRYYFEGIDSVTADPDGEGRVEDVDGVLRDFTDQPYEKVRWTYAPPVLWNEGGKVQRQWFFEFLGDVIPLRHQIRVRMPSFKFASGEAEAVADYFAYKSVKEWPANFARRARLALEADLDKAAKGAGIDADTFLAIENDSAPDIAANFHKVRAWAEGEGFEMPPPPDPHYEATMLRSSAYLARREAEEPGHLQIGESIAVDVVNCYQCHFRQGVAPASDPLTWAPDLAGVSTRLREDWVRTWLRDPSLVYPGTSMPANFSSPTPQYQDQYPNSTNEDQIRVVLEWLFNFDRYYLGDTQ